MFTSITSDKVTDGQRKQIKRLAEDAIDHVIAEDVFDKAGGQKLIEKGDKFRNEIVASIRRLSVSCEFADEEVESIYGYPSYKPESITDQTNRLMELFSIGCSNEVIASQPLPEGAEGWFAIPRWQRIAPTYSEAVQKVLDMVKKIRGNIRNYHEGKIDPQHLRQSAKTEKVFQVIGDQQKNHDILVVPCQLGLRHRGRSVRRALEAMNASEFGLDAFSVGIITLTHPERLRHYDDLWIYCAGDEFSCDGDSFNRTPCFFFGDVGVEFDMSQPDFTHGRYGTASAMLSQ